MVVLRLAKQAWSRFRTDLGRFAGWPLWSLTEPLRSYLVGTIALAVAGSIVAMLSMPWRLSQVLIFIGLLLCGVIAIESTRGVREVHGTVGRDLQSEIGRASCRERV